MVRGVSARWGKKKENSPDIDSTDRSSTTPNQPAHLDDNDSDVIPRSRDPSPSNKKVKKKKKKKKKIDVDRLTDSARDEDAGPIAVLWSRNPVGAKTEVKKNKSNENKPVASASSTPDDDSKPRKKKKKKKRKETDEQSVSFEWSRVPASQPKQQQQGSDEEETSPNHELKKKTKSKKNIKKSKSTQSVDSGGNSNHSRRAMKKTKSTHSVDSTGHSNHSRRAMKGAKSTHSVDSTGNSNHSRKAMKKRRSHQSVSAASLDGSNKSNLKRRDRKPRRTKSSQSTDLNGAKESSNHSRKPPLRKTKSMPRYSRSVDMKGNLTSSSHHSRSSSPSHPKTIEHVTSDNHFDDASDHSQSDESQMTTDDKSLDEPTRHSQDKEAEQRGIHVDRRSLDETETSTEVDYVEEVPPHPKKRHIPEGRKSDPMRIDFAGQIVASASEDTNDNKKASKKVRGSGVTTRLRNEFEEKIRNSGRSTTRQRLEEPSESSETSYDQQEHLLSMLQDLEKLESDLMQRQNVLELEKQSLESRVFEQVQRQGELEMVLSELEEKYEKLKTKVPDGVGEIHNQREKLQTENQVLQLRIKRQEDTLEKYQKPKQRNRNRDVLRMSGVSLSGISAAPSAAADSSLNQSASQIRFELIGLQAKMKEREETLEEQGVRRDELMAEIEKGQHETSGGDEIPVLQARVAELEKEKEEFMKEIARLQNESKELQERKREPRTQERRRTLSLEEQQDQADILELQSILESERKESERKEKEAREQNEDVGFIGWLFGQGS